jgi:DNA-binding transcriptional regulator YdaS (Cro superfamily)
MTDWQYERSMTPEQYAIAIHLLGLSQLAAGRWLGVSPRTSRRYITGHAEIPAAQALLLRAAIRYRVKPVVPRRRPGDS